MLGGVKSPPIAPISTAADETWRNGGIIPVSLARYQLLAAPVAVSRRARSAVTRRLVEGENFGRVRGRSHVEMNCHGTGGGEEQDGEVELHFE